MKSDLDNLELRLKAYMADKFSEQYKWFLGYGIANIVCLAGIILKR